MGRNSRLTEPQIRYFLSCDHCGRDSDEDDRYRYPQREYAEEQGWSFLKGRGRLPGIVLCPDCTSEEERHDSEP